MAAGTWLFKTSSVPSSIFCRRPASGRSSWPDTHKDGSVGVLEGPSKFKGDFETSLFEQNRFGLFD